jgi:hypothetical protein
MRGCPRDAALPLGGVKNIDVCILFAAFLKAEFVDDSVCCWMRAGLRFIEEEVWPKVVKDAVEVLAWRTICHLVFPALAVIVKRERFASSNPDAIGTTTHRNG